jgi:hypothetical protein
MRCDRTVTEDAGILRPLVTLLPTRCLRIEPIADIRLAI